MLCLIEAEHIWETLPRGGMRMFLSIRGKLPMNFEIHRVLGFLARLVLCAPVGFVFVPRSYLV